MSESDEKFSSVCDRNISVTHPRSTPLDNRREFSPCHDSGIVDEEEGEEEDVFEVTRTLVDDLLRQIEEANIFTPVESSSTASSPPSSTDVVTEFNEWFQRRCVQVMTDLKYLLTDGKNDDDEEDCDLLSSVTQLLTFAIETHTLANFPLRFACEMLSFKNDNNDHDALHTRKQETLHLLAFFHVYSDLIDVNRVVRRLCHETRVDRTTSKGIHRDQTEKGGLEENAPYSRSSASLSDDNECLWNAILTKVKSGRTYS